MAEKRPGREGVGKSRREIIEVEIAGESPRGVEVDIAGEKPHPPKISGQLSARQMEGGHKIAREKLKQKIKGRGKIAQRKSRRGITEKKPEYEVKGEHEIVGLNPPSMSWSSIRIDIPAHTLSTSIALPKASRREVKKKREIIGKKPKHEVEGEREKEPKEIAFFKKWAVLPLPTAKTKEVEEEGGTIGRKPRRGAKRDRERAGVKPRREIKRGQKIIEEKLAPMIVEKRPKLEVKKKREIVQKKLTREAKRKYKIAKEKPSHRPKEKRKIPEGEPKREIVEEKTASAIVEEKPKLEVERELELIEEKITPSIAEEKIMPTVIEEKPKLEKEHEVAEEMLKIIPTGISSLDGSIGGGFPSGSLVLLIGDIGSGYNEFAMTSSVMLAATKAGRIALPPERTSFSPRRSGGSRSPANSRI
jgi:hypothetical protein